MNDERLTPEIRAEIEKALVRRKLEFYQPYAKQTPSIARARRPLVISVYSHAHNKRPHRFH